MPFIWNVCTPELLHVLKVNKLNKGDQVNTILVWPKLFTIKGRHAEYVLKKLVRLN